MGNGHLRLMSRCNAGPLAVVRQAKVTCKVDQLSATGGLQIVSCITQHFHTCARS